MPTLRELQEQRETLVAAARERLDQINANTDESRAAELETQHDAAMAELDKLDANIAREERVATPSGRSPSAASASCATGARSTGRRHRRRRRAGRRRISRRLLRLHPRPGPGRLLSDEQRAVLQRGYQAIPAEQRAQTTTNAAGGYTVPVELQAEIIRR
jgi:HK97 family phage major capsid protein